MDRIWNLLYRQSSRKWGIVDRPSWNALTALFTTILTVCGKVNFTNLSRYSDRHEKTFRHQFAKPLNFLAFSQAFIEIEIPETHPVLSLLDASHIRKSGKKTFGLDPFYNGSESRSEQGLEISLLSVVDTETGQAYAYSSQQTYSKSLNPSLTRTDYYLVQLEQARPYLPDRVNYLAVGWSLCQCALY
jgi:hypothetical protein